MSRPFHPDPGGKERERALAQQLAERWRCSVSEFPALSPIDWYLHRGERLTALGEIKHKQRTLAQYPYVYLDVLKYWPMLSGSLTFQVPSLYIVACLDGLYYASVNALIGLTVHVLGRRDRDDPLDVEPCIAIPIRLFKRVSLEDCHHAE